MSTLLLPKTTDDATEAENERLIKRREIRKKIAAIRTVEQRAAIFTRQIADLDSQADASADAHRATCAPLQEQLKAIEEQITEAIADRLPVPPELETQRLEIVGQIEHANRVLEEVVARIKIARNRIGTQKRDALAAVDGNRNVLENNLCSEELANYKLFLSHYAQMEVIKWAGAMLHAEQKRIHEIKNILAREEAYTTSAISKYKRRLPRFEAALAAASELHSKADAESNRLRDAMLNE